MTLDKKSFIKNIEKNFKFEKNPSVAVSVSGGPDSIALLFLIKEWTHYVNGHLISLIVDHNLRYGSSNEALMVSNYLKKKNIDTKILSIKKINILNKSMKEARLNRYNLITDYCKKNNILHLFVGHTKDDNIETFLNRKISGSNFEGLISMKKISLINQVCVIRPLLEYSKKDIINFNKKNKYDFIEDPSNINLNYTRPVIRKFLKDINENKRRKIHLDFTKIQKNSKLYNQMISEILINCVLIANKEFIKIDYDKFKEIHYLILTTIIKRIFNYFFSKNVFIKSEKVHILISQLNSDNFRTFNLKSLFVEKVNNCLIFSKKLD